MNILKLSCHDSSAMGIENYLCSVCGKTQKTLASLKKHQILHTGPKLCCEYCGKILRSKRGLVSHLVTYHGQGIDKAFMCGFCGKHFKRKSTWNVHVNSHKGIKPFHCIICDKSFTQKKSLDLHITIHNGERRAPKQKCSNNSEHSNKFDLRLPNSILKCPVSSNHKDLSEQLDFGPSDDMNGETVLSCYSNQPPKQSLINHNLKYCSSNKKLHSCETCQKEFVNLRNLIIHRNRYHLSVESIEHSCTICQKTFGQKSKLMRHFKLHMEEPQFRCDVCSKRYYRKDNLNNHSKKHQRTASELVCHICEKKFSEPSAMNKHLNHHMHPSHSCLQCVKTFSTQAALRYHIAAHNQVSKYTCPHCDKTFSRKCHYNSHKVIHETNFIQCYLCFKRFNGDVYYKRHLKRAHSSSILPNTVK